MSEPETDAPTAELAPEEKAIRASSFGGMATHYERYRPGPPVAAVDWFVPHHVGRIVDLGAGTGALTRLLIDRADEVVAVEPDDRMRAVLSEQVPGARAVMGRGESMPLPDGSVDAVLASASWHWMDPLPTLAEVARVLVPGGTLGAVWSGPDPEGPFMVQAHALLAQQSQGDDGAATRPTDDAVRGEPNIASIMGDGRRPVSTLTIPAGVPFDQPEHEVLRWEVALDADELIGLLGTLSSILILPDDQRERVTAQARRLLRDLLGVVGDVTVDVAFRADAWRTRRHAVTRPRPNVFERLPAPVCGQPFKPARCG